MVDIRRRDCAELAREPQEPFQVCMQQVGPGDGMHSTAMRGPGEKGSERKQLVAELLWKLHEELDALGVL